MNTATARPTARQAEILGFIRRSMRENGMPPTVKEIMAAFGFASPNGAMTHVRSLVRKGLVRKTGPGKSHCFVPVVPEGACPCCARPMGGEATP